MLKYKEIKQKYKKNFQRVGFNGVLKFKNLIYLRAAGRVALLSGGKLKSSGRQMVAAHRVIIRFLKKRRLHVWSRIYPDFADFYKTKGVRMGGGRGKHFRFKIRFPLGQTIFEANSTLSKLEAAKHYVCSAGRKLGVKSKLLLHD